MVTLGFGGLTTHYILQKADYCNRIMDNGTITNPYLLLMYGKDNKVGVINGQDSACGSITGVISSFKLYENIDLALGGYNTNFNEFRKRNLVPPSVYNMTPVVGVNYKINIYKNLNLNNLISYGITTTFFTIDFLY